MSNAKEMVKDFAEVSGYSVEKGLVRGGVKRSSYKYRIMAYFLSLEGLS